jgi:hypothetical protein
LTKAKDLTGLEIRSKKVTSVNTSKNKKLQSLDVMGTKIKKLDTRKNTKLSSLYASGDVISKSKVVSSKIKKLFLTEKSAKLNISKFKNLSELVLEDTDFKSLVLKNKSLTSVNEWSNDKLTKVDVTKLAKLRDLTVTGKSVKNLKISAKNKALRSVSVNDTALTTLNLNGATKLSDVFASGAKLKGITFGSSASSVEYLYLTEGNLSSLDVSKMKNLRRVDVQNGNPGLEVKFSRAHNPKLTEVNYSSGSLASTTEVDVRGEYGSAWTEFTIKNALK